MSGSTQHVVLCDEAGRAIGVAERGVAHRGAGMLHLAFSVYVFSPDRRRLLIQQRSGEKPLWPGVWANTCCSHPRAGEAIVDAAARRLREEMGLECVLSPGAAFVYHAQDPGGRGAEHEYDVILVGTSDRDPTPDPAEVADWKWVDVSALLRNIETNPEHYAPWFRMGLPKAVSTSEAPANSSGGRARVSTG